MAPRPPKAAAAAGDGADAAAGAVAASAATTITPATTSKPNQSRWSRARAAVGAAAAASSSFRTLRDMVGDGSYVPPSALRRVRRLGEGGFATVELCDLLTAPLPSPPKEDRHQQRNYLQVAVKRLRPHLVETRRQFETFAAEVSLLRRLRHPNIAGFVGAGTLEDASSSYIVQEYVSGGTVRSLITRHVMTQRAAGRRRRAKAGVGGAGLYRQGDAVDICLGVAKALAYLHSRQPMVIHRDVKPDNVLLVGPWPAVAAAAAVAAVAVAANGGGGGDGSSSPSAARFEAKLTDFGLSATVDARKAKALKQLVRRASERAMAVGGGGASSSADAAGQEALKQQQPSTVLGGGGSGAAPATTSTAADEWAVEGGTALGRGASPPAPFAPLSIGSPEGSVLSRATTTAQLDAVFDRRLSSRALLSPALLRELEQQQQQQEDDEEGRRGASALSGAISKNSAASAAGSDHHAAFYELTSMTGSLLYMAPEVYLRAVGDGDDGQGDNEEGGGGNGGPSIYNEKADVFSFAILLRELLSAYLLSFAFVEQAEVDAYVARVAAGYRPPLDSNLRPALRGLIADCWHQDPRKRPSMAEVVERLQRVAEEGGLPRVAVDGGGWDRERGEVGGVEGGGDGGGGTSGGGDARCCAVM
jgi:serine/threonine protein kinase